MCLQNSSLKRSSNRFIHRALHIYPRPTSRLLADRNGYIGIIQSPHKPISRRPSTLLVTPMTTWREFLVKHAKFPFPQPVEDRSFDITDISNLEVGLLAREWRAQYAVRDETLVQKLCQSLENTLGDTLLPDDSEDQFLSLFGRRLQFRTFGMREVEDRDWSTNGSERQVRIPDSHSRLSNSG